MTLPTITTLPETPSRQDPTNFSTEADAFLGALPTFGTELNSLGSYLDTLASTVDAQADAAINSVNAQAWVSGQSYSAGDVVYSNINFLNYRANTSTSGTTDPSLSSSWGLIGGLTYSEISTLGTTEPSKFVTADANGDVKFANAIVETVYTLTGTALDPNNGTMQVKTLSAPVTLTDSLSNGESLSLQIINGSTHAVGFPSTTWVSGSGNVAPTLTANDTIVFFKIASTLYGVWVGSAA